MEKNHIRNFCIIAHIDHGKSTLADRFLEMTKTVEKRKMREQYLDQMDLERERGITIKLQPVRMMYGYKGEEYMLNLIDTPGHVDFSYEVSRSLAAVEGAILLVDATKGVQAQTLANLYLARQQNLVIIPAINKIDLPGSRVEEVEKEIRNLGIDSEIFKISAKDGLNVEILLQTVIEKIPFPRGDEKEIFRALVFDSNYDSYKGVLAYIRVVDGEIKRGEKISFLASGAKAEVLEPGIFNPRLESVDKLRAGEIGYLATGLKDVSLCRVGDTISSLYVHGKEIEPLAGYQEPRPMIFASFYPAEGNDFDLLKEALSKLKLSDASLVYEPEHSEALGRGFKCGFLGMLHMEIVTERLRREYNIGLIVTTPSVVYRLMDSSGAERMIYSPQELPDPSKPWRKLYRYPIFDRRKSGYNL
jgi:GTP-binding protein LepA